MQTSDALVVYSRRHSWGVTVKDRRIMGIGYLASSLVTRMTKSCGAGAFRFMFCYYLPV